MVEHLAYNEDVRGSNPLLLKKMYLIIIFLPLVSSFLSGIFGRKVGPKGASIISVICLILGYSQVGKAFVFGTIIQRFKSFYPIKHFIFVK